MIDIDFRPASYLRMAPRWRRCLDVVDGLDSVHAARELYLPRLGADHPEDSADTPRAARDYNAYIKRAGWFGATARTIDNMIGMVFRTPPVRSVDALDAGWVDDIGLNGVSLDDFTRSALDVALTLGRGAALIDFPRLDLPSSGPQVLTVAEAKARNIRPYWAWYEAPDIVNWQFARMGGRHQLALVVLREAEDVGGNDDEEVISYRICRLREVEGAPQYTQEVITTTVSSSSGPAAEVTMPEQAIYGPRGALGHIPLHWFDVAEDVRKLPKPPLLDLVDKNLEYYNTTALHRHGQYWTATPQAWGTGVRDEDEREAMNEFGPRKVWFSSDPEARFGLLEFTGAGLGSLRDERHDIKAEMATLGARVLATQRTSSARQAQRTATEVNADVGAETSQLARIAGRISLRTKEALKASAMWAGATPAEVESLDYGLNTDYVDRKMDAQELTALVAAWQSGGMSHRDYAWNLKQGERLAPETTVEDAAAAFAEIGGGGMTDELEDAA